MKTLKLVFSALADLFIRILPRFRKKGGFAFLVHPRDLRDVYKKYPFFRLLPVHITEKILTHFWPVTVARIEGVKQKGGEQLHGWIISVPITAKQMMRDRELALHFIKKACSLAEKKGAALVGLGALTASFSRGGKDLKGDSKVGIVTGRIFTSKIIVDTVEKAATALDLNKDSKIAIVGAAGSIGTACAQLLAFKGFTNMLLVDLSNKNDRIKALIKEVKEIQPSCMIEQSNQISSIRQSDIIIAATNRPDALIRTEHLKPGAVVVDDAQPSDVDPGILRERDDVLILEGGVAHMDGVKINFNLGLKHPEDIFSCLAETIILAYLGSDDDFQVGQIMKLDFDALKRLEEAARKIGIRVGDFQNFEKVYTQDEIAHVRSIIHQKK